MRSLLITTLLMMSCAATPPPDAAPIGYDPIPPATGALSPVWNVSGRVLVRDFDAHRLLIAVDSAADGRAPDGIADHVMLATTAADAPAVQRIDGEGSVEVHGGVVRVTVAGQPRGIIFLYGEALQPSAVAPQYLIAATLGLSDTTGNRFAMEDLARGGVAAPCDDRAQSGCFRLGSGRVIQFPL